MNNINHPMMIYTDLLTIAMPVFERKDFFLEALESALNQTVKCEVIVVDNCSSHDYFKTVCDEKGVTYYRNKSNIGLYPNVSRCFNLAKTNYVMTLDDDDKLAPNYVESFLKAVEQYPTLDVFYTDFGLITKKGEQLHEHILPFGFLENGQKIIEFGIKYKLGYPLMSSVIKTEKTKDFYAAKDSSGSYDWHWIYSKADKFSFYGHAEKLYQYRLHGNQDTSENSKYFMLAIPFIYDKILKEKILDKKLKRKASRNALQSLIILKSEVNKKDLMIFRNGDSEYERFLNEKLNKDYVLKLIYALPKGLISFIYKSCKKLGIAD